MYSTRYKRKLLKQKLDMVLDKLQYKEISSSNNSDVNEEDLISHSNALCDNENLQIIIEEAMHNR